MSHYHPPAPPNNNEPPQLQLLLEQLRQLAASEGFAPDDVIDLEKSRNVLEATAGDVAMATELYWDDFLSQLERQRQHGPNHPDNNDEQQQEEEEAAPPQPQPVIEPVGEESYRRNQLRRRLEHEFNREAQADQQQQQAEEAPRMVAQQARREVARRLEERNSRVRRRRRRREPEEEEQLNNEDNANVAGLAARAAQAFLAARGEPEESASVSDDEAGGVWKMVGGIAARLDQEGLFDSSVTSSSLTNSPKRKRRKKLDKDETIINKRDQDEMERDGYLSDHDWLWESLSPQTNIPRCAPFDLLWRLPPSLPSGNSNAAADNASLARRNEQDVAAAAAAAAPPPPEAADRRNVIMEEDEVADEGEEEESNEGTYIPSQWLNAGFVLSDDGTGLVLKSPSEDDIGFYAWKNQQQHGHGRGTPPPPYHCSSTTAILAIVNGLIYTGATYQTGRISCTTVRKPFNELTVTERRREFESRLADALAVLLHIAARTSNKRKLQALQTLKRSKDPTDMRKWQKLQRKLGLCPTCWWDSDSNGDVRVPQGRETDRNLQVATSYTNANDLRAYVMSNMRSFTSKGGCALFLETILRIHGKGAVMRMITHARSIANHEPATVEKSLISCTCEEQSKKTTIPVKQLRQRSKTKEFLETLPSGHDCMSIELLSLLLTGKVHSTFKGWSTGPLGLGILSNNPGEVGRGLTRPEKPVWILCGPKVYSLIVLDKSYDQPEKFARADQPDSTVELAHLSYWPGQRHRTTLRLSAAQSKWVPPAATTSFTPTADAQSPLQVTSTILLMKRRQEAASMASADDLDQTEQIDPELIVTEQDLESIRVNLDDMKFYPDKYHMWRYNITDENDPEGENNSNKKVRAVEWVPYHRLTDRQKLLVETKMGPQINTILWTRWPRALIEGFNPEEPSPLV